MLEVLLQDGHAARLAEYPPLVKPVYEVDVPFMTAYHII